MNTLKGFISLKFLLAILFVLVVIEGAIYYVTQQKITSTTLRAPAYQHQTITPFPRATISPYSLVSRLGHPTLTGSAENTTSVTISISNINLKCGALENYDTGIKVPVVNGLWSLHYTQHYLRPCSDYRVTLSISSRDPLHPVFLTKEVLTVRGVENGG